MESLTKVTEANPFIIAEVGSNWDTFDDCLESIGAAKRAGADAVKFQMFDLKTLYGFHPKTRIIRRNFLGRETVFEYPREELHGGIHRDWVEPLYEKCKALGIEFMCTPFSVEDAEFLNPFVNYHKVASSDLDYKQLFEAIVSFKKPVFFSTGGHNEFDIQRALTLLGSVPSVIMYCVSAYPARAVQLQNIQKLKDKFKNYVGYSDHTTQILDVPLLAADYGAVVIEKHFKIRDMDTPDNPHSLTPDEFQLMVLNIRGKLPVRLGSYEEKDMYLRHNRRLVAIRDIKKGEKFILGVNYGPFRCLKPSYDALTAWLAEDVNLKTSKVDIFQGDPLKVEYLGL